MSSIAERHKYILDKLNEYGFIRITDVADELGVTKVTIRNDVKILESKGLLYKVHGSARLANPYISDRDLTTKRLLNREAKQRIAYRAMQLINDGDSIMISAGSTAYALAEAINENIGNYALNVVTPFLKVSELLCSKENIRVEQLGGRIHSKSCSTFGDGAEQTMKSVVCSMFFVGVDGVDPDFGITTSTIEEAKLSHKMMSCSSKTIVLADSSKFGQRGFGHIAPLEDVDIIITDDGVTKEMRDIMEEMGIELIIA